MSAARISLVVVLLLAATLLAHQPDLPRAKVRTRQTREQIARWVKDLGDDEFLVREAATRNLEEAGLEAEADLQVAVTSKDPEVVHRASELLDQIQQTRKPFRLTFQSLTHDQALEKARTEKKVVMIHFRADWCGPCKMLEQQTFFEDQVHQFLTEKIVAIKLDTDANDKLTRQYKVNAIPSMVFVDGDGKEVGRLVGFVPPLRFLEEAGKFIK